MELHPIIGDGVLQLNTDYGSGDESTKMLDFNTITQEWLTHRRLGESLHALSLCLIGT